MYKTTSVAYIARESREWQRQEAQLSSKPRDALCQLQLCETSKREYLKASFSSSEFSN